MALPRRLPPSFLRQVPEAFFNLYFPHLIRSCLSFSEHRPAVTALHPQFTFFLGGLGCGATLLVTSVETRVGGLCYAPLADMLAHLI